MDGNNMDREPQLGKIREVRFGHGGYQDAMIGIQFTLGGEGWGVGDFWGEWAIKRIEGAQWTEGGRITGLGEMVMRVNKLLLDAKVEHIHELKGIPVRVFFKNFNHLDRWEVLTEVL